MRVPKTDWRVVENWRRLRAQARHAKRDGVPNPTGFKRQYVPGTEYDGAGVHTPFFAKLRRKHRAARRVAHESRRRNHD